jgi:hypothetical protein
MVKSFISRSGRASLRVDGISLHSPFDPIREASKFVDSSFPAQDPPAVVILLGEGLGYVSSEIRRRFPSCRIVAVYYSQDVYEKSDASPSSWHPGSQVALAAFLRSEVGESDVEGLRMVEWPPSARIFPEFSRKAHLAARLAIGEASGSFMTTVGAGKSWIRNTILSFLGLDTVVSGVFCRPERPVLITASGPSLEALLPAIRKKRDAFQLWALPSCLSSLRYSDIEPDLVILTDPGYWATSHMHFTDSRGTIALPLSAARSAVGLNMPKMLIGQPIFAEEEILRRARLRVPMAPPHGTVAATAIELAQSFCRSKIIVAGLDLCLQDVQSHARPNAFDRFLWLHSTRTSPHYSRLYWRACALPFELMRTPDGAIRIPLPLRTYAGWLGSQDSHPNLYRLNPSRVELPSMTPMGEADLMALPDLPPRTLSLEPEPSYPPRSRRRELIGALLDEWENLLSQGASSKRGAESPALLALAYHIEAQRFSEARRHLRFGRDAEFRDTMNDLLLHARLFLESLREKAGV